MQTIKVSDVIQQKISAGYTVTKLLECVDEALKKTKRGKIIIDFTGASINSSMVQDKKFKKLLLDDKYKNVEMHFSGDKDIVKACRVFLTLAGKDDKIVELNYDDTAIGSKPILLAPTSRALSLEKKLTKEAVYYNKDDKRVEFYVHKNKDDEPVLDAISSIDTIGAINLAIQNALKKYKCKSVLIDTSGMVLYTDRAENILKIFITMLNNFRKDKIEVQLESDNETDMRYLTMVSEIPNMEKRPDAIIKLLDENLEPGTVGLLSEYIDKPTKRDSFGHYGNGEVATRQVAIYTGRDKYNLNFTVFEAKRFLRNIDRKNMSSLFDAKFSQLVNRDTQPQKTTISIPVKDIGVCKFCDGPRYYFSLPVQERADEFVTTHYRDLSTGKLEEVKLLLPTFISLVLSENNEKFNESLLEECEERSISNMNRKNIFIPDISEIDFYAE